jgi:hypothetical protein
LAVDSAVNGIFHESFSSSRGARAPGAAVGTSSGTDFYNVVNTLLLPQ